MTTTTSVTQTVQSADGTEIAFERIGSGPPLIQVDGALCYRAMGPSGPTAKALADRFTVYSYDRRGRGGSGDTQPYAVEREVEDLAAVIAAAGGSADVFGQSSGAALALQAATGDIGIRRLALYEAPFVVDDTRAPQAADYLQRLEALVAAGKRGDAVKLFMTTVGAPWFAITIMRIMPVWSKLTSVAPTLPYDFRVLGDTGQGRPLPADRWQGATMPTLVMNGGKSPAWMQNAQRQLSDVLPNARYETLPDQTHMLKPAAVAPVLTEFFS